MMKHEDHLIQLVHYCYHAQVLQGKNGHQQVCTIIHYDIETINYHFKPNLHVFRTTRKYNFIIQL